MSLKMIIPMCIVTKPVKDRTNELMNILTDRDGLTKEDQQKRKKRSKHWVDIYIS